jgi:cytochrome c553
MIKPTQEKTMKHQILAVLTAVTLAASANAAFAGDVAAGKAKAATCAGCHGANGISAVPTYPNLAGQKEAYIAKQLHAFKDGTRKEPTMSAMATPLTDAEIADLAAYYSSLK